MTHRYLHGHHDSVLRSHRWRTADNSAAHLTPLLTAGMSLLDVGCGPGTLTRDLAVRVAPGRVVGIDAADEVLEEARRGAPDNVTFAVGDAHHLGDDRFDVVHAHQVLQHLADPVSALTEMLRVADRLVAVRDADYAAMTWWPRLEGLDRWAELYQRVARASGGEPNAGRHLEGWMAAAGADDVVITGSEWQYRDADRAWWGDLWAERSVASTFAEQALERGLADHEDLAAIAAAWRTWADTEGAWFTIPHGEAIARLG